MAGFCPHCGSMIFTGDTRCKSCRRPVGDLKNDGKEIPYEPDFEEIEIHTRPHIKPKIVDAENPDFPFFPYKPREIQMKIITDAVKALDEGKHIVFESGTGTGKTIVSLSSALEHARKNGKKIVYLTRTISQSDQVMRELRAVNKLRKVTGITVTGRNRSCPLLRDTGKNEMMNSNIMASLCEEKKRHDGCRFYNGLRENISAAENFAFESLPTSEEMDRFCENTGMCPYEAKKSIMPEVDVVVAPYIHFLSGDIRDGFLGNLQSDGRNMVLIIDEAHNIVDAARQQESFSIPMRLVEASLDEVTTMKSTQLIEGVGMKDFINEVKNSIKTFANDKLFGHNKEGLIPPSALEERIKKKFELNDEELKNSITRMKIYGEERTDALMERGETKISDVYTLAICLEKWLLSDSEKYVKTIRIDEEEETMHAACIDPYGVTEFIRSVKGVIHMSGTLQPLDQYVKLMSLPEDTVCRIYGSTFPKENRSVIYLGNVTTKYSEMKNDPSIFSRMEKNIAKLCNHVDKNTLVFFPSYSMLNKMRPFLERDVIKQLYWEESKQQRKTMDALYRFRKGSNGVFFTVMGGSIAEGIDFPGDELCFAIIVGIPYPPPTLEMTEMSRMIDEKYGSGSGWKYTSEVPALRKMQQAIGRLIRTENDRGMAVIFDSRASKYKKELDAVLSTDPLYDVLKFFNTEQQK